MITVSLLGVHDHGSNFWNFEKLVQRTGDRPSALGNEQLGKFGSPRLQELELTRMLDDNWNSVLNWLRNLDLLRAAGLGNALPRFRMARIGL
jgi:hypothetical protein